MDLDPIPAPDGPSEPSEVAAMAPLCAIFRRYLKSQGLKYTPERADILDAIIEKDDIFEAEELLLDMRRRGHRVSKATIYRTIKLLQEAGIITQALFDAKQAHYQLVYGRQRRDFMVCVKTGRHVEFTHEQLTAIRDAVCREFGWTPVGHRFQIYAISPEARTGRGDDEDEDEDEIESPGDRPADAR